MGRKKKDTRYFTEQTEAAIIAFNKSTDQSERDKLYAEHIHYSFYKLAENVLNTWGFTYFDDDKEDEDFGGIFFTTDDDEDIINLDENQKTKFDQQINESLDMFRRFKKYN